MLPDLTYLRGESLDLEFKASGNVEKVVLIVKESSEDASTLLTAEANFENGKATLLDVVDIAPGDYVYQVNYVRTDDTIKKYAGRIDCESEEDDCPFPVFKVCPALDAEVS